MECERDLKDGKQPGQAERRVGQHRDWRSLAWAGGARSGRSFCPTGTIMCGLSHSFGVDMRRVLEWGGGGSSRQVGASCDDVNTCKLQACRATPRRHRLP